MAFKHKILLLCVLGLMLAAWLAWLFSGHGQGYVETHQHLHIHGEGTDHGHDHPESDGPLTHSHQHRHDRHHHGPVELPFQGLSEIGHSHNFSNNTYYFAKLVTEENGRLVLSFFSSTNDEVKASAPTGSSLNALIFIGSKLEGKTEFQKSGDEFTASLPENFLVLPTSSIKILNLEFGDLEMDVTLPITK